MEVVRAQRSSKKRVDFKDLENGAARKTIRDLVSDSLPNLTISNCQMLMIHLRVRFHELLKIFLFLGLPPHLDIRYRVIRYDSWNDVMKRDLEVMLIFLWF